jgi:hypothetical protein
MAGSHTVQPRVRRRASPPAGVLGCYNHYTPVSWLVKCVDIFFIRLTPKRPPTSFLKGATPNEHVTYWEPYL